MCRSSLLDVEAGLEKSCFPVAVVVLVVDSFKSCVSVFEESVEDFAVGATAAGTFLSREDER